MILGLSYTALSNKRAVWRILHCCQACKALDLQLYLDTLRKQSNIFFALILMCGVTKVLDVKVAHYIALTKDVFT